MIKSLLIKKKVKVLSFEEVYELFKDTFYYRFKKYSFLERDDAIQESGIGLYIAYQKYDINYGYEFSTFAARCIDRHFFNYGRKHNSEQKNTKNIKFVPIESTYHFNEKLLVKDVIPDTVDSYKQVLDRIVIEDGMKILTEKQRKLIIDYYFKDMRLVDIAEHKKSVVPTLIKRKTASLKKLKEYYSY